MINVKEYTDFVNEIYYTEFEPAICYAALGLAGESGETVDAVKKQIRDSSNPEHRDNSGTTNKTIALELGDTLYYLTKMADILGYTLIDIMQMNKDKLEYRKLHGKKA